MMHLKSLYLFGAPATVRTLVIIIFKQCPEPLPVIDSCFVSIATLVWNIVRNNTNCETFLIMVYLSLHASLPEARSGVPAPGQSVSGEPRVCPGAESNHATPTGLDVIVAVFVAALRVSERQTRSWLVNHVSAVNALVSVFLSPSRFLSLFCAHRYLHPKHVSPEIVYWPHSHCRTRSGSMLPQSPTLDCAAILQLPNRLFLTASTVQKSVRPLRMVSPSSIPSRSISVWNASSLIHIQHRRNIIKVSTIDTTLFLYPQLICVRVRKILYGRV